MFIILLSATREFEITVQINKNANKIQHWELLRCDVEILKNIDQKLLVK